MMNDQWKITCEGIVHVKAEELYLLQVQASVHKHPEKHSQQGVSYLRGYAMIPDQTDWCSLSSGSTSGSNTQKPLSADEKLPSSECRTASIAAQTGRNYTQEPPKKLKCPCIRRKSQQEVLNFSSICVLLVREQQNSSRRFSSTSSEYKNQLSGEEQCPSLSLLECWTL